ncbi:MAG TPA: pyrroloquinoline quinone biosynthesis protein PqqE [Terriglobales bacterium]|nr:pyrroloquinoline quinone biosynthesis protein PqqE [Terriglobales bacterium]
MINSKQNPPEARLLALIAEITHRCPLHCVYCSNPLELATRSEELITADWLRVFREAAALGVLHLHLTGGEPLARADLAELIGGARASHLYTNLITSGIGLSRERLQQLVYSGLDHIQLSFQDTDKTSANWIAGARAHGHKLELAEWIRDHRIAFTANLVVHRQNIDHLEQMIATLESLRPDRMEIAHTQYYGWALRNRSALLPTRAQLDRALATVAAAEQRMKGRIRIDMVVPDYYARFPKACMGGWGRQLMLIDPAGRALPCHAAGVIPGLQFDNVRDHALGWIWADSAAFRKFRGEDWMPEPCRSCDRREEDFGGCRCQALLLTGNASATDPVCELAPMHHVIEEAIKFDALAGAGPSPQEATFRIMQEKMNGFWRYRIDALSRRTP